MPMTSILFLKGRIYDQQIQLQLSQKQRMFSQFSSACLKSTSNVEHFETKDNTDRLCIFEIRDYEICG